MADQGKSSQQKSYNDKTYFEKVSQNINNSVGEQVKGVSKSASKPVRLLLTKIFLPVQKPQA